MAATTWIALRVLLVTLPVATVAACTAKAVPTASGASPPTRPAPPPGPVVEVVPTTAVPPPLDPTADPRTPLGELRSRYLPVWSPDFDWAFPPEVCGSDWALDAVAEATTQADMAVLGDTVAAAALSVMRWEYLLSRAAAEPNLLAQLCVAIATVGASRSHALEVLELHLAAGTRSTGEAGYPDEVVIVAAAPLAALAVACVTPGYPRVVDAQGQVLAAWPPLGVSDVAPTGGIDNEQPAAPAAPSRLQAYLLTVARGLEDQVVDISYRVSEATGRPADDCDELGAWAVEWDRQASDWAVAGELWGSVGRSITAEWLCEDPPPDGPDECPRDWSL